MSDTKQDMPDVIYAAQWMDSKCNILRDYSITPASHSTKYISEHKVETIKEDEYLEGYKTGQSDLEHKHKAAIMETLERQNVVMDELQENHKAELLAVLEEGLSKMSCAKDWDALNEIKKSIEGDV